jgi:hypothetical protein
MILFYAWMTTLYSAGVWRLFPSLAIVQFPWRLGIFASFGIAAISGFFVNFIPKKYHLYATIIAVLGLLIFNLKFFVPQGNPSYTDNNFLNQPSLDAVAKDKIPEYLPSSMSDFPSSKINDGLSRTPINVFGNVTLTQPSNIVVATSYMPQWELLIDARQQKIHPSSQGLVESDEKIQTGTHILDLVWRRTFIEKSGIIISALSLLAVIGLAI